jgi:hypothetical protein
MIKNSNKLNNKEMYIRIIDIGRLFYMLDNDIDNIEILENYITTHAKEEYIFTNNPDDYSYASMLIELAIRSKRFDIIDIIQNMITERM